MTTTTNPAAGQTKRRPAAVTPPRVIGLDLSLTCTGVAGEGWTANIRTKFRGDHRLAYLVDEIKTYIHTAGLVVMEGPSFGHAGPRFHEDLAGLRVAVRLYCHRQDIPYAVIPPTSLKLYATGYGRSSKGEVRSAVADRYGIHTEGPGRYDEADAYAAMAAGRDWLGYQLALVPVRNQLALDGAAWPDREAVA